MKSAVVVAVVDFPEGWNVSSGGGTRSEPERGEDEQARPQVGRRTSLITAYQNREPPRDQRFV